MKSFRVTQIQKSVIWLVILLLTIFSRFYLLTNKPIHFDEGINGWFSMQMTTMGFYKYDPTNYHGPLYFYLLHGFEALWGQSMETLRAVPSVFAVFCVMLFSFPLIRSKAIRSAMMFFLFLSPAFLFYGRSAIHETPFVFFQLMFALGMLRWHEEPDSTALGLLMTGVIGMATLKETFVLSLASWAVGLVAAGPKEIIQFLHFRKFKAAWSPRLTYLTVILLLSFVMLFTGFFRNMVGLVDFVKAFLPWMKTGVGENGHNKEFWYWVKVLAEAEPIVLFGVGMAILGMFSKDARLRMVSAFSIFQLFVYSWIPYKTVWCILSLVWGFYFVLAIYAEKFFATRNWRSYMFGSIIVIGSLGSIRSDWRCIYSEPIDMSHPYIYVNSTYDMKALQDVITQVTKKDPALLTQPVQLGMKEQWPYPWLFRDYKTHWDICGNRVVEDAWIYFCDASDEAKVESELKEKYLKVRIFLRQQREISVVYLRKNLFDGLYKGQYQIVGPAKENP